MTDDSVVDSMPLKFRCVAGHFVAVCETPVLLTKQRLTDAGLLECIRIALAEHGVLVFPGQSSLHPEDEFALAQCFPHDPSEIHPSESSRLFGQHGGTGGEPWLEDCPAVRLVGHSRVSNYFGTTAQVRNYDSWQADQRAWHQDGTADTLPAPPRVGLLRGVLVPSHNGDTLFACTRALARHALAMEEAEPDTWDPPPSLARALYRRPGKARLALDGVAIETASGAMTPSHGPYPLIAIDARGPFVIYNWNLQAVVRPDGSQLSPAESWAYARRLFAAQLCDDQRVYRHRWAKGDLVLWDNWATIYSATAASLFNALAHWVRLRLRLRSLDPPRPWRMLPAPSDDWTMGKSRL